MQISTTVTSGNRQLHKLLPTIIAMVILSAAQLPAQSGLNTYKTITSGDTIHIWSRQDTPDCEKLTPRGYPKQEPDDYLHEERFDGMQHIVIFDHIVTRKMLNVFLPQLNDPDADLCGVQLILTNPYTQQVVVFYDIFNWINKNGVQIFNANRELADLWGFTGSKETMLVKMVHVPTGTDYGFGHSQIILKFTGL